MIYDRLTVALLGALATERDNATNAHIARYLITHQEELGEISVKGLASACNVGTGSISRFCREVGFESFDELRREYVGAGREYQLQESSLQMAKQVCASIAQVEATIDRDALERLVDDLCAFGHVMTFGMLKAQAAAVDLQVDLLMQGKYVETCVSHAEQLRRISEAGRDTLIIVFSYTGSYFDARDLNEVMRRADRPKVWVVCGKRHAMPGFVGGRLLFSSAGDQVAHPYQLELAAGMIAQEYAKRTA